MVAAGSPGPWEEFVEAVVRPEIDETGEDIGEIGLALDAVKFATLDQRGKDGPIFGAIIVPGEESILSGERLRAHGPLDDVGVELDAAIIEETDEAVPVIEAIAENLGNLRLARHSGELLLEEGLEGVRERSSLHLACGTAFGGSL